MVMQPRDWMDTLIAKASLNGTDSRTLLQNWHKFRLGQDCCSQITLYTHPSKLSMHIWSPEARLSDERLAPAIELACPDTGKHLWECML